MLSAGLLGGPGIGYTQDRQAIAQLRDDPAAASAYDRFKAEQSNRFLFFPSVQGLDQAKVAVVADEAKTLKEELAKPANASDPNLNALNTWWETVEKPHAATDKGPVVAANIDGGRKALQVTALVPATMAVCYLLLVFYFMAKGGYKAIHLDASGREVEVSHKATDPESMTGGVPAPVE
jgi:hypothetical protein